MEESRGTREPPTPEVRPDGTNGRRRPHERLTTLCEPAGEDGNAVLSESEKASVMAEANACLAKMKRLKDTEGNRILSNFISYHN